MMEATPRPSVPYCNLKSSENCHRYCTSQLAPHHYSIYCALAVQNSKNSARRAVTRSTHMRFSISHENGEQGHASNYVCCGFPLATPPVKTSLITIYVSRVRDSGAPDGFDFKHFQYNDVSPSSYSCSQEDRNVRTTSVRVEIHLGQLDLSSKLTISSSKTRRVSLDCSQLKASR